MSTGTRRRAIALLGLAGLFGGVTGVAPVEAATKKRVGLVYDIGGRGDQSFNDAAAAGLDKARKKFGIKTKDLEPNAGGQNREELLRLLSRSGYGLNFAVGFAFADSVTKVAKANPKVKFAIVDSVVPAKNVASLVFSEEQGSYLVGAAAAKQSKTGKIGFIGGVEVDLIKKFEAGYAAGAKKVNPNIQIEVKYISQPPDFSGFGDPAKGKEIGLGMYSNGADVVYHAAGGSGGGLFEAAKEHSTSSGTKVWAIGVDSDQYRIVDASVKPYILTSMLKRVNVAVYETAKDYVQGRFKAKTRVFDLKSNGVGYSTSGGFVNAYIADLERLKTAIIRGEIKVPQKP